MHLKALTYQVKKSQQISNQCFAVFGHSSVMWVGNHGAQLGRIGLAAVQTGKMREDMKYGRIESKE